MSEEGDFKSPAAYALSQLLRVPLPVTHSVMHPGAILPTQADTRGSSAESAGAKTVLGPGNPPPSLLLLLQYCCGLLTRLRLALSH